MKNFFKIIVSLVVFFFLFDFIFTKIINKSNDKIYTIEHNGFYELNKNLNTYENFGSKIYKVYTDEFGNRIHKNDAKIKYDVIFLGDSFVFEMGDYKNSIISIVNKKKKINILNSGVPSYSPTTYLYSYEKNLKNNLLVDNHIVLLALDISDVQDEAGRWITKEDSIIYNYGLDFNDKINSSKPSIITYTLNDKPNKVINDNNNIISNIKNFCIKNLKFSLILYRFVKFSFIGYDINVIFDTSRSAFTWRQWDELDLNYEWYMDNLDRGYKPLGVNTSLEKIKNKTIEITNLAKKNNSKIYFVIYPWPAQIKHKSEIFSWPEFINGLCKKSNCDGVINTFSDFLEYAEENSNWYEDLYIKGDVHFNKKGNEIIANNILKINLN